MIECTLDLSVEQEWCILDCQLVDDDQRQPIGKFQVMSGDYNLRNKIQCSRLENAAIPEGLYYIVDKYLEPPHGPKEHVKRFLWDLYDDGMDIIYNNVHNLWLALYRDDGDIDDNTDVDGTSRGHFRLHPLNRDESGTSDGCITLRRVDDFLKLLAALKDSKNKRKRIPGTNIDAYGTITVTGYSPDGECHETKLDKSKYPVANKRKWTPHFLRNERIEFWPFNTIRHKILERAAFNDSGYFESYREQLLEFDKTSCREKYDPTLKVQHLLDKPYGQ